MTGSTDQGSRMIAPFRLLAWSFAALVFTGLLAWTVLTISSRSDWLRGLVGAAISVAIATALTVRIVCAPDRDPARRAFRVLTAGMVRFFAAIVVAIISILLFKTPPIPTLISLVPLYLVVLATESILLHRALWKD